MEAEALRLLEKLSDKIANKIAVRLMQALGAELADKITERVVDRQRMAGMTDEQLADEYLRRAGWTLSPEGGWTPPPRGVRRSRKRANSAGESGD